jgi:hypothetical protein
VYDYVYKGLVQPLLGTFTLGIGDIMHQQKTEREALMLQSNQLIQILKTRIKQIGELQKQREDGGNN